MRVDVVRPRDLDASQRAAWRALCASGPDSDLAFLGPGFAAALDAVRDDTRVAVVQDAGATVGFLPFHSAADGGGLPLGAGLADANAPVLVPGCDVDPQQLVRACGLRRWSFDHLVAPPTAWARWQHAVVPSPVVDLAQGIAGYHAELALGSSSLLATARRKKRRLEKEVGPVRLDVGPDPAALVLLREWKSAQYARSGQWDRFAVPWIVALIDELTHGSEPDCLPSLAVLRAGDRIVAVHFGLRTATRLAWWFPAYDPALARCSPGTMMLLELAASAAAAGVQAIDLGRGQEDYKTRLATSDAQVGEGWVPASGGAVATWHLRRAALAARGRTPRSVRRWVRTARAAAAGGSQP